jgi:heme A synthase
MLFLGLWATYLWIRSKPLEASWFGAAIIAELLIVVQGLLGAWMYLFQGLGPVLPRPFMHILYGIVALITLPAAWAYFGNLGEERVKTLAMGMTCVFLWGILLRASSTAQYLPPVL